MRSATIATILVIAALLASAVPALAAKGGHDKFRIDETFTEELCGLPDVLTHVEIKGNVHFRSDGTIIDNSQVLVTWTNDEGDWVTATIKGSTKITETDNGDGTVTIESASTGPVQWLRSSEGPLYKDRGRIVGVTVVDFGDPDDPSDDVLISEEIVFQAGPHPQADSGFTLFCPAVLSVLA